MKRSRDQDGDIEGIAMAKCLMMLSRPQETKSTARRVFECRTCSRQFSSFQALGGHRASHKKQRLMGEEPCSDETKFHGTLMKHKTLNNYECSVCGMKFITGQALGGHMRRHKAAMSESFSSLPVVSKGPVVKRSNSRRVLCLDLNLTPLENDLELLFGKLAPKVDNCFI